MQQQQVSDFVKANQDSIILKILRFGIKNLNKFNLIEKPHKESVEQAYRYLEEIEAI